MICFIRNVLAFMGVVYGTDHSWHNARRRIILSFTLSYLRTCEPRVHGNAVLYNVDTTEYEILQCNEVLHLSVVKRSRNGKDG